MAKKCTLSKKRSNTATSSLNLSSNYRYVDESCKIFSDSNTIYFQCLTCDESRNSYICIECKRNGNHEGHYLCQIDNITEIVFCDCGDANGIYFCGKHIRFEYPDGDKPLYRNEEYLNNLSEKLNLDPKEAIKLCRISQIRVINLDGFEGKLIQKYFNNTNAHNFRDLEIKECWSVYRKDQEMRFLEKEYDKTRRLLLWHGTKKESFDGIMKNGFRKPNADGMIKNGAMFGRGIYFADRSSKSIQYCDKAKEGYGILFLCEVAVGAMYRTGQSRDHREIPSQRSQKPFDSIKGLGKRSPDKSGEERLGNIIVPCGTTVENPGVKESQLKYNEYIVFDADRVLIRYIVAFKVNPACCIM